MHYEQMGVFEDRQTARASLRIGQRVSAESEVTISTAGLLAVAVLVTGTLLSTAVLVSTSIRADRTKHLSR